MWCGRGETSVSEQGHIALAHTEAVAKAQLHN